MSSTLMKMTKMKRREMVMVMVCFVFYFRHLENHQDTFSVNEYVFCLDNSNEAVRFININSNTTSKCKR